MKRYRALIPIVLVVLMAVSWYMMINNAAKVDNSYNNYLSEARRWANEGIMKYAIENYNAALRIKDTPEIYVEISDFYKKLDKPKENLAWCKDFFEKYPTDSRSYDCLLDAYYQDKDYESCYDILETAEKRNVNSDYIKKVREEIKYEFWIDFNSYSEVGVYSNNYCAVKSKDRWGFVDRYGNIRISSNYLSTGAFTQSGFASVVNTNGDVYFIDKTGAKVIALQDEYESFGLLVGGVFPAKKTNGRYVYLKENKDLDKDTALYVVASEEYEFASTFNNGIAAVKKSGKWQIINSKFEVISDGYLDIKLDEKSIAYRNERLFVSKNEGTYIMVDSNGKQIGDLTFEDAKIFNGEEPASVCVNGKWRYIDKNGKFTSDKTFDDARSYSNGMATVCVNEKWGFIDENESIVIEPQFFDAKDFNEKGSCFVKTGDKWQLMKLYRLNREG